MFHLLFLISGCSSESEEVKVSEITNIETSVVTGTEETDKEETEGFCYN